MNHASKAAPPSSSVACSTPALSEKARPSGIEPGRLPGVRDEHVTSLGGELTRVAGNPQR
jgi:hypothetical protein